jgi:hypothetical protein
MLSFSFFALIVFFAIITTSHFKYNPLTSEFKSPKERGLAVFWVPFICLSASGAIVANQIADKGWVY